MKLTEIIERKQRYLDYVAANWKTMTDADMADELQCGTDWIRHLRNSQGLKRDNRQWKRDREKPPVTAELPPIPKGYKPTYSFNFDPCLIDAVRIQRMVRGTYGQ